MFSRSEITRSRRWVVKIGSAMLTGDGQGVSRARVSPWAEQMANHIHHGGELVLVSSGAVAEGMARLGMAKRPSSLHELQALAAIGQMGLVRAYEACFIKRDLHASQILLSRDDLTNRERYLNARSTLRTLMDWKVVPVINENDTVATEELRFGDNDTLSALVANLISADLLILLTDQKGLYESDPRFNPEAKLISQAEAEDPLLEQMAGDSVGGLGRGGMATKIKAAQLAARSGTATVIAWGGEEDVLKRIGAGEEIGTLLTPSQEPQTARKRWLAGHLGVKGSIILDAGAVQSLRNQGCSLLAVGVKGVNGKFARGDVVSCRDEQGREIARGLINYDNEETDRIKGLPTRRISEILGYIDDEELIHRDNLSITIGRRNKAP
jgi:glutamate 5-kinase